MVRVSGQAWRSPTGGSAIAGGFVLVPVGELMAAWRACRERPLGVGDFRAWLAAREMVARRRCAAHQAGGAAYSVAELARLLGVGERTARASIRRLVAAGLLAWSDSEIGFPPSPEAGALDAIGGGRGSVAIPRRMLRHLAAGAKVSVIATALAALLRCLSRRRSGWCGRGRFKASWVAGVFGLDARRIKCARLALVALGWLKAEATDQRAENRWGRAYRVNLAWCRGRANRPSSTPPPGSPATESVTPSVDPDPLPEREEDQEPASGGPAGFEVSGQGGGSKLARSPVVRITRRASSVSCSGPPGALKAPTFDDIQPEDLRDVGRLLELHGQAVTKGLVTASEADRLRFVGAAEHALAIGSNPAALFAWLVLNGCWRYVTGADEDSARRRLRVHDFGQTRTSARPIVPALSSSSPIEPGGLSEDARVVKAVREACIRAGVFRDPWPAFHARNPGWDRGRWEMALVELGLV